MSELKGKCVLITGGARRLGRAVAIAMAQAGANVAFTYLNSRDDADKTLAVLTRTTPKALAVACDVREESGIERALKSVLDHFGKLDLLINNAGVFKQAKLEEITADDWDEVFAVNVRAPFLVSRYCIPLLRASRGRIIHMGSLGGEKPWATHAHYCSSKAALHMLTQVMAKALAPEIAVNCVAPGMIEAAEAERDPALLKKFADRTPMRRNGSTEDVVNAVMYFATAPHFITGQVLKVDGGLGLR